MGRIEVDEEKLRRFVNASLFTCMVKRGGE